MSTMTSTHSSIDSIVGKTGADRAFFLLRTVFTIAPIAFGLDKFFNLLTNWEFYLAPWINNIVPGDALWRTPCGRMVGWHHRQPGVNGLVL